MLRVNSDQLFSDRLHNTGTHYSNFSVLLFTGGCDKSISFFLSKEKQLLWCTQVEWHFLKVTQPHLYSYQNCLSVLSFHLSFIYKESHIQTLQPGFPSFSCLRSDTEFWHYICCKYISIKNIVLLLSQQTSTTEITNIFQDYSTTTWYLGVFKIVDILLVAFAAILCFVVLNEVHVCIILNYK